ncbi:hypothetical protein Syun_008770 [Stephania yunnanensis]|uniref:Uncharacterized protein n=1 Tax=Stephania yunnanensis TaxID=152371 RepID=A0AAP0PRN5_9MAGN
MEVENVPTFSSRKGVSVEINSQRSNPLGVTNHQQEEQQEAPTPLWLQWASQRSSFKVFPTSNDDIGNSIIDRSLSRPSSHFCDLNIDQEDEEELDVNQGHVIDQNDRDDLEKQNQEVLEPPKITHPKKTKSRLSVILLDQGLFTIYKRLFMLSLVLNITALVLAATGHFMYARNRATLFSIGNILALTLCRCEAFLRIVFWLAVNLFGRSWVPLKMKTSTTSFLQSLGGIHSGCGVSSIGWLVYAIVLTLKDRANTSNEIIAVAAAIFVLLCLSSLAAFPLVRHLHHNVFERTHRFAGWSALLLLWAFIILKIGYNPKTKSYNNLKASNLMKTQEFWFTAVITAIIILPWLTVRRVAVKITHNSTHASVIKFEGNGVKAGILGRISPSPLSEWHAFGIISDGEKDHMMLAGAVGDFTKSLVSNPPSHLWVRKVHFAGLPYLMNMYERVQMVATGSGICVFLSFLMQRSRAEVRVLWVAKGVEENYGREIKEAVYSGVAAGKVVVYDSGLRGGRPNVGKMSVEEAKRWGAQVVVVTSNPEGSRDVVRACENAGIPAFGPIWDS